MSNLLTPFFSGSMCHIGQTTCMSNIFSCVLVANSVTVLISLMQYGTCIVQPKRMPFSTEELVDMIKFCNLNRLWQFASFFSVHLRAARKDPSLLSLLVNLEEVTTTGLALSQEDEAFAYSSGIKLKVHFPRFFNLSYFSQFHRTYSEVQNAELQLSCQLVVMTPTTATIFDHCRASHMPLFPFNPTAPKIISQPHVSSSLSFWQTLVIVQMCP